MGLRGRNNLSEERFFFVTTTVVRHLPAFADENACDILVSNIKHYQKRYAFKILAYVIMPSHFHWILFTEPNKGTVSDIMRDIKKYSAWDLMQYLHNTSEFIKVFNEEAKVYKDQKRKFWIPRFHDEVIRNQKMFWSKLRYIHYNPVEVGIVGKPEEYKYSSARNYINDDHSVLLVDTEYAGIEMK